MIRKIRFKQGERVNAISLSGKRVLGVYRGLRPSFGCYVYGLMEGQTEQALHVCHTLTLERPPLEKPKKQKRFQTGDYCTGLTPKGLAIRGKYMNSEGKYAWIKGWPVGTDQLNNSPQAWKVLTAHLEKA